MAHGRGDWAKAVRPVEATARIKGRETAAQMRLKAVAVELNLMDVVVALRRVISQRGELRRDEARMLCPLGARNAYTSGGRKRTGIFARHQSSSRLPIFH